ncbi:50S ribosomal protein L29 [Candidatus Peregrinibacteria bacterium]|nr:50S ribosomal protein L29 [Candidatus Peregrinibacteria bacterium]
MTTFVQITGMSIEEIRAEIQKSERELLGLRMKIKLGQEKNNSKYRKLRKYIAQLKTAEMAKISPNSSLSPAS